MTITEALKQNIAKSGVTLYRVAKDSGVKYSTLARFVSGERPDIRLSTVEQLAAYFGLELSPIAGHQPRTSDTAAASQSAKRRGEGKVGSKSGGAGKSGAKPKPPKVADAGEVPKPVKGKRR